MKAPQKAGIEPKTIPLQAANSAGHGENIARIAKIMSGVALVFSLVFIGLGSLGEGPQPFVVAGLMIVSMITSVMCVDDDRVKNGVTRLMLVVGIFNIALICIPPLFANLSIPVAVLALVMGILAASLDVVDGNKANGIISMGLSSAFLAALLGSYSPFRQIDVPALLYLLLAAMAFILGLYIYLARKKIISMSLRIKITIAALGAVIVPLVVLSFISSYYLTRYITEQTNKSLMTSANVLAQQIDQFFETNRNSVMTEGNLVMLAEYLKADPEQRPGSQEEAMVKTALDSLVGGLRVKERTYLISYALLNPTGFVVYSTDSRELNANEQAEDHFLVPWLQGTGYYSPVVFSRADHKPYLYFSTVIRDAKRVPQGVLRVKYDAHILQSYASDYSAALGTNSRPALFNEFYIRLADPMHLDHIYTGLKAPTTRQSKYMQDTMQEPPNYLWDDRWSNLEDAAAGLANSANNQFVTATFDDADPLSSAAVIKLTSQPWYVVYLDDQATLTNAIANQNKLFTLIATIIAGLVSLGTTLATRVINDPIGKLIVIAQAISNGKLDVEAKIDSQDEMGMLASAFNLMARQLQQMITGLEDRVRDRTIELEQQNDRLRVRARQMETVADVARGVASAQEMEALLQQVTMLVSERFNFYHVGIFLIDEQGEFAVLRAANSEGGQKMLDRQHKLKVGQVGMVGYVTETGEPRIATDVGQDAIYFNNPDLPLTRSEMALPLKVGERVIGALDVQSVESNAFTEEDIQLFSIMADQVAIAIYNNMLYSETAHALSEAQQVHRNYLAQEWRHEAEQGNHLAYRYTPAGLAALPVADSEDIENAMTTGAPVIITDESGEKPVTAVTIPVKLRGETIGVIRVQNEAGSEGGWTDEHIETVQAVADQVALALENARLFTQTTRRAERERKVLEITSKIRSTTDPRAMLQIAVEELQKALHASRAQVILQPQTPDPDVPVGSNGHGNGNGNGNGHK